MTLLLSYWLFCISIFKFIAFILLNEDFIKAQLNNDKSKYVNSFYSRLLRLWFSYTCVVSLITSFNLNNKPCVMISLISFLFGLPYLIAEFFVYKTYKKIHSTHMLSLCVISIVWLFVHLIQQQ